MDTRKKSERCEIIAILAGAIIALACGFGYTHLTEVMPTYIASQTPVTQPHK